RNGYPLQTQMAKELHREAGVPEGPCGLVELEQFQKALPQYQIKVLSVDKPHCIIFCGPPAPHVIQMVKVDDGCTSFGGFLSKSYFCHHCNRAYDHENLQNHPCEGRRCSACEQFDCPDYQTSKNIDCFAKPTIYCKTCNRCFFGENCMSHHLLKTPDKYYICQTTKKCPECCAMIHSSTRTVKKGQRLDVLMRHKCGLGTCYYCGFSVMVDSHKCYIQHVDPSEDEPKKKRKKKAEEDEESSKPPPLFVYAAMVYRHRSWSVQKLKIVMTLRSSMAKNAPKTYLTS
ncbi:uncharacterized protein LOC144652152, partial [Oculina patagonica]